ncbi:MAG: glutamate--tRNA ligase family protein, partial [Chthoniobacterales bacterium]
MTPPADPPTDAAPSSDFIREIVAEDLRSGKHAGVHTRFPPEPNGYLHIGHAKAICLGFGIAQEFGGLCNIRMDDTNPAKEEAEYVDSILEDVRWLVGGWAADKIGLKPAGKTPQAEERDGQRDFHLAAVPEMHSELRVEPFYASDYFEPIYEYAVQLTRAGRAYVCDMTPEQTDEYRRSGQESPFRHRSVAENLNLLARMKAGEFPDGARTLRAKIDMASPNMWLRDPLLYRIRHLAHHHTGADWCIYPMYDFAHCLSDYIEGITHSLCT